MRETKKQDAKIQDSVNRKSGAETLMPQVSGAPESGKLRSISTLKEDIRSVPHHDETRADPLQGDVRVNNPAGFPEQVKPVSNTPPGYIKKVKPVAGTPAAPVMK